MRSAVRFLLLAFLTGIALSATGENLAVNRTLELEPDRTSYQIAASPIVKGSEVIRADSLDLRPGLDYKLDHRSGLLTLLHLPEARFLELSFLLVPLDLVEPRYQYEVLAPSDSLFQSLVPRRRTWLAEEGQLLISGSKTFAVTFSDDAAFDLKQSLYVNLDGELSRNVNISAQLSDSQSKLTPEGDSKELSSLDKVFIRVYGTQYEIAMGDLEWQFDGTRYINYRTNIEGINAWYRQRHFAQAGFTAAAGKAAFNAIAVVDGKQGPYYLNPTGFQSSYLLIAGSEKIYRNGILLERGTDYYIDYSEGSVMFRNLVVSSDLINAYFQYADDYFRQSTAFNSSRLELAPGLALSHHFIYQSDARDDPLLYAYTPSDLDSLRLAGDRVAWGNGVTEVEPGAGTYIRRFTDTGLEYYEYAPSDSSASFNVTFSFVGSGNGDYEQFSSGKYRYLGPGLGAWLPQKRLVPAVQRSNADLALRYDSDAWKLGVEGIYTVNDKNTFSSLNDGDNRSGLLHAYAAWLGGAAGRETTLRLEGEKRWADSYLFSQAGTSLQEIDLALVEPADSLSQYQLDLTLATARWEGWKPQLALRYRDVAGSFVQKALRFSSQSSARGLLPLLQLRSTLSAQDPANARDPNSLQQYHDLSAAWEYRWLAAKLAANYNALTYSDPSQLHPGSRYLRFNPQLALGDAKTSLTQFSLILDSSALQAPDWQTLSQSRTYGFKHNTTTLDHTLNLDFTHRELRQTGEEERSNYDLINFRNSHNFLKQAIMLLGNYQLNQTEFYPRIRELEYVGVGLGLYDSTGVYTPNGDYDYTYITSDQGTLSSEINTQLSLYLKPGNILPRWNWLHMDLLLNATEQSNDLDGWRGYLFLPGAVFNDQSTIFGKQGLSQTLWLDIVSGRLTGNLNWQYERSLDNRYQSQNRATELLRGGELDLKRYLGNNYNLKYENSHETDSRYQSDIRGHALDLLIQRNLDTASLLTLNLSAYTERGDLQGGGEDYRLRGLGIQPGYRGVWGKTARLAASFGLRANQREGSDFLSFLPEKRGGTLLNWTLAGIYRLNSFSTASLDYSGTAYPGEQVRHTLKLEFKAEL